MAAAAEQVVAESGCKTGIWAGHGMGTELDDGVDIGVPNHMKIVPNMVLTLQYKDVHYLDELKALIG